MAEHYLIISIGPVQEFIQRARRSRDLWLGSHLLSEVSKAVAKSLYESPSSSVELIFPNPEDPEVDLKPDQPVDQNLNVANKIVAIVQGDPDNVAAIAKKAQEAAIERIYTIYKEMETRIKRNIAQYLNLEIAKKQVKDLIEFYWSSSPIIGSYAEARERAEAVHAAVKNTRRFQSAQGWADYVPKSSLDGLRESVISEECYKGTDSDLKKGKFFHDIGLNPGERLCGVGLLKRLGVGKQPFPSTSHMASLPFLLQIDAYINAQPDKKDIPEALEAYLDKVKGASITDAANINKPPKNMRLKWFKDDGRLFYLDRLGDILGDTVSDSYLSCVEEALNKFLAVVKRETGLAGPSPYYALLLADGDRMGKAIDKLQNHDEHRELSQQLATFAGKAHKIVTHHHGQLVYAGGDDVLAFLPLHTVLACSKALAEEFRNTLEDYSFEESGETYTPTLSVGVVIAHHLTALEHTRNQAKKAEETAKKARNSLAITLDKRGGAPFTITGLWSDEEDESTFYGRLEQFVTWHRNKQIPEGAAYQLRQLSRTLAPEAATLEAKRILKRKQQEGGAAKLSDDVLDKLLKTTKEHMSQLPEELIIAAELSRAPEGAVPQEGVVA